MGSRKIKRKTIPKWVVSPYLVDELYKTSTQTGKSPSKILEEALKQKIGEKRCRKIEDIGL